MKCCLEGSYRGLPEETEREVLQKLSGAQSVQSNMGDRQILNSSWIHPASSVLPIQAHQFCLNDLAHPFPGCPGNKAKKVSTELNGHQNRAGYVPCQHAWTR